MILASLLLLASTLHAGPERAITTPVRDASPSSQFVVAAAAGDDGVALVVWHEHFAQFAAARIDREGRRLDQRPIALAAGSDVARGDGGWLVAGARGDRILAQLVSDDGTAGEAIELAQSEDVFEHVREVRVAFDGTHYLVVWNLQHAFEAARLDAGGRIVEQGISFEAPGGEYRELDVTAVDGRVAVVTLHFNPLKNEFTVEVYRLDENLTLIYRWLDRTSTAALSNLKVTADGSTIVAAWRAVGIGTDNVFVAREGEPLRIIASHSTPLDITRVGGTVYVVLTENSDFGANTLVSETGTREWTWPSLVYGMAAATFGDRVLLVAEAKPEETDLYTTVLDAALEQVAPVELLALEPAVQERPAIARAANGLSLVVWVESGREDGARIAAARIDGAGRSRDPEPIIIAAGLPVTPITPHPQVATDGEEWLVVWSTGGVVRSRRVLRDGTLAGPPVSAAASYDGLDGVCVAWNGREYLAGYVAPTDLPDIPAAVFMVPISRTNVPGSPVRLSGHSPGAAVHCAAAGGDTLFGWLSGATIVGTDGTTSGPLAITNIAAVASDGERFAVVRYRFDGFDDRNKLERAIVSRQGTVSLVNEPLIAGENPALAATRDGFLLAWDSEDLYSNGTDDVFALLMDREGRAVGEPFALAATALREQQAALAGGDVPIAVYMKEVPSPLARRYRVFARTLGDTGPRRRAIRH